MTRLRRHSHERLEVAEALVRQNPVVLGVEQAGGGLPQRWRAIRSGAKMHTAFAVIAQIQLGKCRLVAARKRRRRAALFLQPGEREFDVLAGAQLAGGVIGTRTEIAAWSQASNRHAIARFRHRIGDPKLGEERLAGRDFQARSPARGRTGGASRVANPPAKDRRARGCARAWVPCSVWSRNSDFGVLDFIEVQSARQRFFARDKSGIPCLFHSAEVTSIFQATPGDGCL